MKKPLKDWKVVQLIQKTVAGENKLGEVIHGALDILPIPNQPLGKLAKAILNGQWQETKNEILEAFTLRNIVAIALTTALIMGWLTPEDIELFMQVLNELL